MAAECMTVDARDVRKAAAKLGYWMWR